MIEQGFWARRAFDGLKAAAEALFPENTIGAPDFRETKLFERSIEYFGVLPPKQRRLMFLLFVFVEIGVPSLSFRPRRFSKLSKERRLHLVRALRASRLYPFRLLGDAVKGVLTMMYMSHPRVIEHIGMFSACEHPKDALAYEVRSDALVKLGTR